MDSFAAFEMFHRALRGDFKVEGVLAEGKIIEQAALRMGRRQGGFDDVASLYWRDEIGAQDITIVAHRLDGVTLEPRHFLADEIRSTEVGVAVGEVAFIIGEIMRGGARRCGLAATAYIGGLLGADEEGEEGLVSLHSVIVPIQGRKASLMFRAAK